MMTVMALMCEAGQHSAWRTECAAHCLSEMSDLEARIDGNDQHYLGRAVATAVPLGSVQARVGLSQHTSHNTARGPPNSISLACFFF